MFGLTSVHYLQGMDTEDGNPESEEQFENEFSLEMLSEAYAEVMRSQEDDATPGNDSADGDGKRGELIADKLAREADEESEPDIDDDDAAESEAVVDDDAACPVTPESIVESILFVGCPRGEQLTAKKIAAVIRDVSPKEIQTIVQSLNEKYERDNRAWRIEIGEEELKMKIADDLVELQNEFHGRNREASLSQGAIDVLSLVAYQQPISREEIEGSREKASAGIIRQLLQRNLIVEVASEKGKRGKSYQTSDRFLSLFGLDSVDELPHSQPVEFDDF